MSFLLSLPSSELLGSVSEKSFYELLPELRADLPSVSFLVQEQLISVSLNQLWVGSLLATLEHHDHKKPTRTDVSTHHGNQQ